MTGPLGRLLDPTPWASLARRLGATIAFAAACGALWVVDRGTAPLETLRDRMVGMATLQAIHVDGRVVVYVQAILAAVGGALVAALALRWLQPRLAEDDLDAVEGLSWLGLGVLFLVLWNASGTASLVAVVWLQALVFATILVDAAAFRRPAHTRATWTAWLVVAAMALLAFANDLGEPAWLRDWHGIGWAMPVVAATAFLVHLASRAVGLGAAGERREHALTSGLLVLALLPLAAMVARETAILTQGEESGLGTTGSTVSILVLLALLGAARAVRTARAATRGVAFELERPLASWAIPLFLVGWLGRGFYVPVRLPPPELFESGNPGLFIQQFFEFGRLPFVETFNGHGLSDALLGFLYALLNGTEHAGAAQYDVLVPGIEAAALFLVLWFVTRRAALALALLWFWPLAYRIVPPFNAFPLLGALLAVWAVRRADRRGWLALAAWCAFMAVWRLDLGISTILTSACFVAIAMLNDVRVRSAWRTFASSTAIVAGTGVILWTLACAWRGVNPLRPLGDVLLLMGTNQAFGYDRLAFGWDAVARWHYLGLPALVFASLLIVLWRLRAGERLGSAEGALAGVILFACIYQLGFFPRALGRHSLYEGANTMSTTYAFIVPGLLLLLVLRQRRPVLAHLGLGLVPAMMMLLLDPAQAPRFGRPSNDVIVERLDRRLAAGPILQADAETLRRDRLQQYEHERHGGAIVPFLQAQLAEYETFLDLSNCPMLYWLAHKPSPHWVNHLMLACGDRLQRRVIEDLSEWDVPIVLLSVEAPDVEPAFPEPGAGLDGVPFELRQPLLHEWVHEHYQPALALQRWEVWVRKDWALRSPPADAAAAQVWSWPARRDADAHDGALGSTRVRVVTAAGAVEESRAALGSDGDRVWFLRVEGEARERTAVEISWQLPDGPVERRALHLGAGAQLRWFPLAWAPGGGEPERLEVRLPAALSGARLAIEEDAHPDAARVRGTAWRRQAYELGHLPALLGRDEALRGATLRTLELAPPGEARPPTQSFPVLDVSAGPWRNGIHTTTAAVRLTGDGADRIELGDELVFAGSGARRVLRRFADHALVEGAPLDPLRDGAPARVVHRALGQWLPGEPGPPSRFEPLDEPRGHVLLYLDVENRTQQPARIRVDAGVGERFHLRLVFLAPVGDSRCAVPVSFDYNWVSRPIDRLWIVPQAAGVLVRRAELVREAR